MSDTLPAGGGFVGPFGAGGHTVRDFICGNVAGHLRVRSDDSAAADPDVPGHGCVAADADVVFNLDHAIIGRQSAAGRLIGV